ncbi:hypothetical protein BH23GEM3_BH23GEM3_01880 [soil metagenome]
MNQLEAFDFPTKSFRLVRLLSELQDAWKADCSSPIGEFLDSWLRRADVGNLETFSFVNQQTLVAHLYMVVVWYVEHQRHNLFAELFNGVKIDQIPDLNAQYANLASERRPVWPELDDTIKRWDKQKGGKLEPCTLQAFLEHVRNAVSHGRVEFLEGNEYRFLDQNTGKNQVPHTCIEMTFATAARLADALYLSLALDVHPPSFNS